MEFGERTQDCSPGHTAKGPHLVRTGASRGYSRAAAPVWPPLPENEIADTKVFSGMKKCFCCSFLLFLNMNIINILAI